MKHPRCLSLFSEHSRPSPKPDDSICCKRNNDEELLGEEQLLHASRPMSGLSPYDEHKSSLQNSSVHCSSLRPLRRSFSGLSHAIDGLRSLSRKPNSRKQSGQLTDAEISTYGLNSGHIEKQDNQHYVTSKCSGWLQRHATTTFRHHRRSLVTHNTSEYCVKADPFFSPTPSDSTKPPRIPENLMSGASARAAAATQNDLLESIRTSETVDLKLSRDSESGIGIELQDRIEDSEDVTIRRRGECTYQNSLNPANIQSRFRRSNTRRACCSNLFFPRRSFNNQCRTCFQKLASLGNLSSCLEKCVSQ